MQLRGISRKLMKRIINLFRIPAEILIEKGLKVLYHI